MDNNTDLLTAALEYAAAGFRVLPISQDKKALVKWKDIEPPTTDESIIREWWKKVPRANIALATGETANG